MSEIGDSPEPRPLSPREAEVVQLVGEGLSNKEIALRLGINPETVETHLKRARGKLGATDRRDAARKLNGYAVPNGGGPPSPGIASPADRPPTQGVAGGHTPPATGGKLSQANRRLQGMFLGLDPTGTVGRILWMGGLSMLIGLLAIGLLVAADGFTLTVHNITANGHAR